MLVLSAVLLAGATVGGPDSSDEVERLIAVEDEYVAAEITRDEEALRRIVDDRFVLNSNDGKTTGKDALIQTILGWNMTGQTITERTAVIAGETGVIFGTAELRFGSETGEETRSVLRYTATYVRKDGEWSFLALHMARRSPSE